ncbi:SDR family NAD(P)-dependent oxidoreductase [Tomitella biformata]|uniref:SDR family NAD(P)-dependent oxidoreductase n=1 Tax=Tomitella biformata TaxID=630403 RepID=UPI0004666F7E|nr:SDR family oxidoreductase [Tomitella biformata]
MGTLDGKVALITGAGQGIGQGIAFALAKEGASIAVLGRTERKLVDTCAELVKLGVRAEPITCDVSKLDALEPAVAKTVDLFGGVDILVNNANSSALGSLLDIDLAAVELAFNTGPLAALHLMRACHPHMKARGGGSIINMVTSAAVRWDVSGYGAYAASKEAMRSFSRTAASEWGPDGIRVNAVAPHAMSPGLKWWTENRPEEAAEFVKTIPLGRIGECEEDIGRAVVFLCGPDARYLTGATIPLDGGQARWS